MYIVATNNDIVALVRIWSRVEKGVCGSGFATKEYENGKGKKHCAAALLNITGENVSNGCARGRIVRDYLNADIEFHEYVKILEQNKFSGFSLVAVEISKDDAKVFHYSNAPKIFSVYSGSQSIGFGNSPTYTPLSKVTEGRYTFDKIVSKDLSNEEMVAALLELLKSDTSHLPDEELQRRSPMAYSGLSSIFVKIKEAGYGTRAHSIILVDSDWNFQFIEHALKQPINIDKPEWNVTNIQSRL
ncbi:hypothetical protein NQ315_010883 [Exocentrus adspersus]|uniref:Uncharacterized protein n=1 Tax=Exocentrus adspersus TaxID=1586481 RepID=A0AAV8VPR5_9CUCU|nr:hypothetical protein NQ315_010883 [Exocentrus adspersus]